MTRHLHFIAALLLLLAACSAPKPAVQQLYLIQLPDQDSTEASLVDNDALADATCLINNVMLAPAFSSDQIALRDKSHQIEYFDNHRWAVQPSQQMLDVMLNYFYQQNIFSLVAGRFWKTNPDYTISTDVFNLEVNNLENKFKAHLNLRFVFIRTTDNHVLVEHRADREEVLAQKNLNMMAAAVSSMFYEELQAFTGKIRNTLSASPEN